MNSKERVLAALHGKTPDRIPYGEYAIDFDTVEKIIGHETYLRAKAKSRIAFWEGRRDEVVASWREDMVELFTKLDCLDIVNLAAEACGLVPPKDYDPHPPKRVAENIWEDEKGNIYQYSPITEDITVVKQKEEDLYREEKLEKPDPSVFEVIDYVIDKLGDDTFIIGPAGREAALFTKGGIERGLVEYILHPEAVREHGRREVELGNREDEWMIRPGIDAIMWGQDFAYNQAPFISPLMFQEFALENCRIRAQHIKENYHLPVIKHACGNNRPLLDMFLEIGYDCYQAIQKTAGMDLNDLKEELKDRICLWGGYSLEHLILGQDQEIKKEIQDAIKLGREKGGLILGSSHSVAVGSNYDTFMAALHEVGKQ